MKSLSHLAPLIHNSWLRHCRHLNGLVEAALAAVRHVDRLDYLGLQPLIEHLGLAQLGLEIGGAGQDEPDDVGLVGGRVDEEVRGELGRLAQVVVPLLHAQAGEAERGLPSPPVLLGQVHAELVHHLPAAAAQRAVERPVAVHDDEAEPVVGLEELAQCLGVELVVAEVERRVDGTEGLEVEGDLLLLAVVGDDGAGVEHEPVGGHPAVELEPLLGGGYGGQHGLAVHPALDVGGGPVLVAQHLGHPGDLVARRHDERDHARAVAPRRVQPLDQLLHLPYLDVLVRFVSLHHHLD